jgi:hypothetical protein
VFRGREPPVSMCRRLRADALPVPRAGGLSENDFILAAKIEEIDTSDLIKKIKRFWA